MENKRKTDTRVWMFSNASVCMLKNLILFTLNLTPSSRTTNPCVGIKSPSAWVPLASVMVNWTDTVPNVPFSGFRTTYRLATLSLSPDREVGSLNRKCLVVLNEITPCPSSLASIVTVAIRKEISSIILIKDSYLSDMMMSSCYQATYYQLTKMTCF